MTGLSLTHSPIISYVNPFKVNIMRDKADTATKYNLNHVKDNSFYHIPYFKSTCMIISFVPLASARKFNYDQLSSTQF